MGIANKIINILVLIAAIGAAVCAFLLWQKREQITKGREMLSGAIVQAVDKIGPKGQIQGDSMSIKLEADQLKDPVEVLRKNIEKICKQRDELAKAFAEVVNSVNALSSSMEAQAQLNAADLVDYDKYGAKCDEGVALVTARVNYYRQRSEIMRRGLKELSAALELAGLSDKKFWDNDALKGDLAAQARQAADFSARFHKYSRHIVTTTEKLRKAVADDEAKLKKPSLGLGSKNWQKELEANMAGISTVAEKLVAFREAVEKLKSENDELRKQLSEKDALLKKKDKEIAALTKDLAEAKAEIKRLKKIIDPSSDEDGNSAEAAQQTDYTAVRKLVGKITYVNPTYGFVTIDLGLKSTIKAIGVDGNTFNRIVPLPQNAIMTVATSLDPADAKYVARISVARIGLDSSIANVLPVPGSAAPKVGDIVFFSESDIRQMMAIRELELKQREEAAASERSKAPAAAESEEAAKEEKGSAGESGEEKEDAEGTSGKPAKKPASSESDDDEE